MPTIGTYLSNEDYEKHLEIKSKGRGAWTEFIHQALNVPSPVLPADIENKPPSKYLNLDKLKQPTEKPKEFRLPPEGKVEPFPVPTCEHGNLPKQCNQFGCVNFAPLKKEKK